MKEYILYTFLFFKKQFYNKIYICFLILLPICLLIADTYLSKTDTSSSIPVGYYFDFDNNDLSSELSTAFEEVSGRLNFINYTDLDAMLNDTSNTKLECSYVLTEGLIDKIATDNYKKIILVYKSPQTIISDMINELVFAAVYRGAGDDILYSYLENSHELYNDKINTYDLLAAVSEEYDRQLSHGNTFSLDFNIYNGTVSNFMDAPITATTNTLPVHGIIAIFLFLCLLLGCTDYASELEKGTFLKLPALKRIQISSCFIHSWLLPAASSSLVSIILLQGFNSISKELLIMLWYYILLLLFGIVLITFIKRSIMITAMLPLLIIGSLIFTPIIIDISAFIPIADLIEKLFLPYYYIAAF